MRVNVTLSKGDVKNLTKAMAEMPGMDGDGVPKSITIPDVIREALRRMATRGR